MLETMMEIRTGVMIGFSAVSFTGCNTMAGAGKDIEAGGEKIQEAAQKVRAEWRNARERNQGEYAIAAEIVQA